MGTYHSSNSSRDGEEPKHTLHTPVGSMGSGAQDSTNHDEQCRPHKRDLASKAVADESDDDLTNDRADKERV